MSQQGTAQGYAETPTRTVAAAGARLLPGATVTVYPGSSHGAVFQYHREFVDAARGFLHR